MKNESLRILVSTFNDGVNNIYRKVLIDRWYDAKHKDYVFTFNGEVEYLSDSPCFDSIIKSVYGEDLRDYVRKERILC
jgi:hypothetical protein